MTRAYGKHGPRKPPEVEVEESLGERHEAAEGDYVRLPGGRPHLQNPLIHKEKVPVPERREFYRGIMAHGVPVDEHGLHDRDPRLLGVLGRDTPGRLGSLEADKLPEYPTPVPVVIVQAGVQRRPLKHTAMRHFMAPAISAEPESICGQDLNRISVKLLNTDSSHNAWIGQLNDLVVDFQNTKVVGGAMLPKSQTSYLTIETQGPLYVISDDTGTPVISVIIETEIYNAG